MKEISVDDLCIILEDHEKGLYTDPREVHTDLSGVDLRGANLSNAALCLADMSDSNLSGADLSGAKLSKADLREVSGLNLEQLSKVETLYNTKLDPELMEQVKDKYPHLLKEPKEEVSKPDE